MKRDLVTSATGTVSEEIIQQFDREEVDVALKKISESKKSWIWLIFILAATPGFFNGMHIMSPIFFVDNQSHYCDIPELEENKWTPDQIRNVSLPETESLHAYGCAYYNYDYSLLSTMSFEKALDYIHSLKKAPENIPCRRHKYENTDTVISKWNLVCDRYYDRTHIQSAYALGKIFGASFFGIIADKYGRRPSFSLAALFLAISAMLAAFLDNFYLFLCIRFLIGFGAVGCYGTAYTLLSELTVGSTKTLVCCSFNVSFAIGMIILAVLAYFVRYWKLLLIIISIPTLILPSYYWFLPESPQWLLSQNRYEDAWKVIHRIDATIEQSVNPLKENSRQSCDGGKKRKLLFKIFIQPFAKIAALFSNSTLTIRTLICFFVWFTVSSSYVGLAINGENFNVNKYAYLALNGMLEIFSYLLPVPLLNRCGRKAASLILFALTGFLLISISFLPRNLDIVVLMFALFGRFFSTSAYVIFALFTSELFPTAIRNTAIGASLTMSHVGTFVSPYIVDILGAYRWYIPSTIFGLLSILSVFLVYPLPETKNKSSYNNIEEMCSPNESRRS